VVRYSEKLTSAQTKAANIISSSWNSLAGPTVVVLDAPGGRGKTRIIQEIYDDLAGAQPDGRQFWVGRLASDELPGWRQARKSVAPGSLDVTQRPGWLWFGLEAYPLGRVNLSSQLHQINAAVVTAYEEGRLSGDAADTLRRGAGRGLLPELLKATANIITDLVPGGSLAKTSIETTVTIGRTIKARNDLGVSLSIDDPVALSRAVLATMFVAGVLGDLDTALAPVVIALDDAHLVDPSAVAVLDAIMRANPDEELLGSGMLSGHQREFAASRGLPPVVPILLLATSQPANDSRPDHFGARVTAWSHHGLKVVTVGEDHLPLLSTEEAIAVAGRRLARIGLDDGQLRLVVDQAHDRLLDGVNASLLIAHCERVHRLADPRRTLASDWAERYLPRFIEEDARLRFEALPLRAQEAVVAGSLRGPAFALDAVSTVLPDLNQDEGWIGEIEDSGYAQRSAEFPGTPQLVFSDEPSFAFARQQAVQDSVLCTRTLTEVSAPLLRDLWASATVGPLGGGRMLYEISRREAYQYQQLLDEADLPAKTIDAEMWAAALGFAGERQFILEEVGPPSGPRHMRDLWMDLVKGREPLAGDGWAIAARWVVHRHLPGPMTFGTVWSTKVTTPKLTRIQPEARRIAARVAGRTLPFLLADQRPLFEPGLRLLLRLGLAGRLLPNELRRLVAFRLLLIAPLRLSAAVVLARVYVNDLDENQRKLLTQILILGPAPDPGDASFRRSIGLSWLGGDLPADICSRVVDDLVATCKGERNIVQEDTFGVVGRMADLSDPIVYPWAHADIYAAAALLTSAHRLSAPMSARTVAIGKLLDSAESHPGAAWMLLSGKTHLDGQQLGYARSAFTEWERRGAISAGRFDLTGSVQPGKPQPKNRQKKLRRKR